ncbi:MAG: asparagine synthase (glutamine-hydrolyzing) [Actinobacteria bacterium]|nr:asparagine synthase (glutamine-hydrolyzing) [Actinomycetota bacterium]
MCGIAGVLDTRATTSASALIAEAEAMAAALGHRGPDGAGSWVDASSGVALGHRRLAVLDRTSTGAQPMCSTCGRYVVSFNGELYNFRELRSELRALGWSFHGHGDTEVLLTSVSQWGFPAVLERFNGMFALALWDRQHRRLHLARDRFGEKPLYYGWFGATFLFASQPTALRAHPTFDGRLDLDALASYLRLSYVPSPLSVYRDVAKLPPACHLTLDSGALRPDPVAYWSLEETVERAVSDPFTGDAQAAIERFDDLLRDAVRLRLAADVPLGAFLSGGLDSSAVVAAMAVESPSPVRTFTISFPEGSHDEATHAAQVASHLATDHTEIPLPPRSALDVVHRLPDLYDEPFADPSALPTAAMTSHAGRHVTVCLSGDGGDEVLGGYNRYTLGPSLWARSRRLPRPVRQVAAHALLSPAHATVSRLLDGPTGHRARAPRNLADKIQKFARVLDADDELQLRQALVSQWENPTALLPQACEVTTVVTHGDGWAYLPTVVERMMLADSLVTLPDCMLTKVDRASMGVGLEVRVPLLDPRLVEFAWRLPLEHRIRGRQGKWILRQVLDRYVPREMVDRPKVGFDPPIAAWLRGPLRAWGEELLSGRLVEDGIIEPEPVRARWREHLSGGRNWDYPLWTVLVFLAWQDRHRATV